MAGSNRTFNFKMKIPAISEITQNVIGGGILVVFSLFIFIASFSIPTTDVSKIGSAFFPKLLSVILFMLGLQLLVSGLIHSYQNKRRSISSDSSQKGAERTLDIAVVLTPLLIFAYFMLVKPLGFIISTTLYLFFQIWTLYSDARMNKVLIASASLFFSIVVYFIFRTAFDLYLPAGILENLING
jgi:putative tricarboxylic transport membrane protein